jgi:hypothetical protein
MMEVMMTMPSNRGKSWPCRRVKKINLQRLKKYLTGARDPD